ncbi:hypothetical protein ACXR2U_04540 [Jatrophihabitans sp. YIM 134969]
MPRTVRISPVPIPPPPVEPRPRRSYAGLVGVALLALAIVFGLGYLVRSGQGEHSYDRNPTPPAAVRLTAGQDYLLSTVDGPGAVPAAAQLSCTLTTAAGATMPLPVTAEAADSRATHAVGKFVAPVSGSVSVACTGGAVGTRALFVDDADDAHTDLAGLMLLLCVVCAVPAVGLVLGALYRRFGAEPRDLVSGVTEDPGA